MLSANPSDKLIVSVDYRTYNQKLSNNDDVINLNSSQELKLQASKLNMTVEKDQMQFVINLNQTKNKLTSVITILPKFIIKNMSS